MTQQWLQIRGDPAVREFVFQQQRVANDFDARLSEVAMRVEQLMRYHGVFHAKVHFSSGQVTLWLAHDPMRYRVHVKDEFLDPRVCLAYPRAPYPAEAIVPPAAIAQVLNEFKRLRSGDPQIYLRSGSLNIVNGTVGLNFSCDGSHYIDHREFLARVATLFR